MLHRVEGVDAGVRRVLYACDECGVSSEKLISGENRGGTEYTYRRPLVDTGESTRESALMEGVTATKQAPILATACGAADKRSFHSTWYSTVSRTIYMNRSISPVSN